MALSKETQKNDYCATIAKHFFATAHSFMQDVQINVCLDRHSSGFGEMICNYLSTYIFIGEECLRERNQAGLFSINKKLIELQSTYTSKHKRSRG